MKTSIVPACLLALGVGVAIAKDLSDADRASIQPISKQHLACMADEAAKLIDTSNDVESLVEEMSSHCDPILQGMSQYLLAHGFSAAYADIYVETVRGQHARLNATRMQRAKDAKP